MIKSSDFTKKSIVIAFILMSLCPFLARGGVEISPSLLQSKWPAQWITCPGVSLTDYGVFHFRKTFRLAQIPDDFVVHVSGDNRYRLFVNGEEVCHGPAKGDLAHWNFETIDLSDYLQKGKNVIAAIVWNFGAHKPIAQISNKTAFILQGNSKEAEIANTDGSWSVVQNNAYQPLNAVPRQTVIGPGEILDGTKYPYGWELIDFDDQDWKCPAILGHGVPNGQFTGWDWNLVPRSIPFMEHRFQRISAVERSENITVDANFVKGEAPVVIPENTHAKILFDQTFLTTAYPHLLVSKGKSAVIQLDYAESLVDDSGKKGNRDDVNGKYMPSVFTDQFLPDGGQHRSFQPLWFRTYRYLELTITTKDEPLILEDIYGYFTGYPFKEKAYFKSDDPQLEKIWNVGWRTARLCAGETYYDCPYYEQLQYVGDTRIQALISLYVTGDDRLMQNAIVQFANSLLPFGLTQSRYPSNETQVIPPFSLIWIDMVHDYWMLRNEPEFVRQQLNGINNVLYWFGQQIDDKKMLGGMEWWNFVDWSFGAWNNEKPLGGTPPGAMDGNSSILTLLLVDALQKAAELFDAFDQNCLSEKYRQLAKELAENTYKNCWDSEKGLLADTPEKARFSQHANVLAILVGMFNERTEAKVLNRVLDDDELTQTTFYFKFYLFRAIVKAGMANQYLAMLDPWKEMISIGLTTFAETPEPTRSDCHAWSAHPLYDFLATVCGITPDSPGFKTVRIEPHFGYLKWIKCQVPHPDGDITLSLKRNKSNKLEGEIELPKSIHGNLIWEGKTINLVGGKNTIKQ